LTFLVTFQDKPCFRRWQ